jgi:hypothetical protein
VTKLKDIIYKHGGLRRWGIGYRHWFFGLVDLRPPAGVSFPDHPRIPAEPRTFDGVAPSDIPHRDRYGW